MSFVLCRLGEGGAGRGRNLTREKDEGEMMRREETTEVAELQRATMRARL